jgi:hypothetical protein
MTCCPPWSQWQNINMSTKEGYERVQAIRKEHMIHLVLTKLLCDIQVKAGQHFILNNRLYQLRSNRSRSRASCKELSRPVSISVD